MPKTKKPSSTLETDAPTWTTNATGDHIAVWREHDLVVRMVADSDHLEAGWYCSVTRVRDRKLVGKPVGAFLPHHVAGPYTHATTAKGAAIEGTNRLLADRVCRHCGSVLE